MARTLCEGSFTVEQQIEIARPRETVWDLLLKPELWWSSPMPGGRMKLEAHVGGRFMVETPSGDGRLWAHVTHIERPALLRLSGPLAMDTPVSSVFQYDLEADGQHTIVRVTHRAVGIINPAWAESHDAGWRRLLTALRGASEPD